jgi:hypothetical protein
MTRNILLTIFITFILLLSGANAQQILIPMDATQTNHLKAYGIIFNHLKDGYTAKWLLNYRGGSFMAGIGDDIKKKCRLRNVSFKILSNDAADNIIQQVEKPNVNMAIVPLVKAPKIAVYTPKQSLPWDDAVTLALTYAEVPYTKIWDRGVLKGDLSKYDWLHLHHEDFTGQYGKFWAAYRNQPWYIKEVHDMQQLAHELGFKKVSEEKKAVVRTIKKFVGNGGYLFAMCSGTDTFDIALAAQNVDIVPTPFDGDPPDPNANSKLDFSKTLAFTNFKVNLDPYEYRHSDIDIPNELGKINQSIDYFTLFQFSAKWDPVPTMLTQDHVSSIKGFYGQTTAFRKSKIKSNVVILAQTPGRNSVKYIHGNYGKGTFTFYGGHDPEDYTHRVGDPPTDLSLHPNSPGYRLILNNILFPAAKPKKRKD